MNAPYVSVAFANRNDNYGGDLKERINKFIDYYALFVARWPDLFEFVVCDYNPPEDKPRLRQAFPWEKLGRVRHVEVSPDIHRATTGPGARPIIDYTARNVCMRLSQGEFVLVLNQDIFLSRSILEFIATRKLRTDCFYRADRCDFDFEPCRNLPAAEFEQGALTHTFKVNRRHIAYVGEGDDVAISATVDASTILERSSAPRVDEVFDRENNVAYGFAAQARYKEMQPLFKAGKGEAYGIFEQPLYRSFFLHTNAGGDFILAPRRAFFDIHGAPETHLFYMHLDSYLLIQLFSAGYAQGLFLQPSRVYHADHDRSGRTDFKEPMEFAEHEKQFTDMLTGARDYRVNGANWGLAAHDLPVWDIEAPKEKVA